jgi:hypothetical protein
MIEIKIFALVSNCFNGAVLYQPIKRTTKRDNTFDDLGDSKRGRSSSVEGRVEFGAVNESSAVVDLDGVLGGGVRGSRSLLQVFVLNCGRIR